MFKLIVLCITMVIFSAGCFSSGAPACSDSKVKNTVIAITVKDIIDTWSRHMNEKDIENVKKATLVGIRTNSMDNKSKKSMCAGELVYPKTSWGKSLQITYMAQRSEDGEIYVTVWGLK